MNIVPRIFGPESLGWVAALFTLLTFVCADMRRLRLLALAANAAFITYGFVAHLLPVLVLHLALVPVNLWRLNQSFNSREPAKPSRPEPTLRIGRQPSGWNAARRGARLSRRMPGSRIASQKSGSETTTTGRRGQRRRTLLRPSRREDGRHAKLCIATHDGLSRVPEAALRAVSQA